MGKTTHEQFLSANNLTEQPSALEKLTPTLDMIMSCSSNLAHSEYYSISWKVYPVLLDVILTLKSLYISIMF